MQDQLLSLISWEGVGVVFGIIQVVLAYFNSRWNFAAGIVSTSIFIYIFGFSGAGLYAEAALQAYYLLFSIYGLFAWSKLSSKPLLAISKTTSRQWLVALIISIVGTVFIFLILDKFTDSNVPLWDASVSAVAWAGTWLMVKRKLEYWLVLNVSNALAIPLLIYKDLYLTALLTSVLFIVAILGYINWRKKYMKNYQQVASSK